VDGWTRRGWEIPWKKCLSLWVRRVSIQIARTGSSAHMRQKSWQRSTNRPERYSAEPGVNPYDPEMKMDYSGTDYYSAGMDVREALPDD